MNVEIPPGRARKAALAIVLLAASLAAAGAETIVGRALVIDADTIDVDRTRIRLSGLDAPETGQQCADAAGRLYSCGSRASLALADHLGQRTVTCEGEGRDRYQRVVATCFVDDEDIGHWLVRNGHALDWPRYSQGFYAGDEAEARAAGRGVWQGAFTAPWDYRRQVRDAGPRR